MSSSTPEISVAYWSIRGLASSLRMLLMHANIKQNAICYNCVVNPKTGIEDRESWFGVKPALKLQNPFINLPYIIDHAPAGGGGDVIISQTNACLGYLGRKYGMHGRDEREVAVIDEILGETMDLRNNIIAFSYGMSPYTESHATTLSDAQILINTLTQPSASLRKFELHLSSTNAKKPFMVGDRVTCADFHLWEMLHQLITLGEFASLQHAVDGTGFIEGFPRLKFFYYGFKELDENQAYFNSNLYKLPFNNKGARFGAHPSGKPFIKGQFDNWSAGANGVY